MNWDYEKQDWERLTYKQVCNDETYGYQVMLNNLGDDKHSLDKWNLYLKCQHEALSNYTTLIPVLGITQDTGTKNYMIVMMNEFGAIHKLNLIHGNLHSGNLLCAGYDSIMISDPRLNDDIHKVLPSIIYSFGIIIWEMTSGNHHDQDTCLNICKGDELEIIEGAIPEYVELMKRCWDNDPEKRPTVNELSINLYEWSKKYPIERNDEKRIPVPENEENEQKIKNYLETYACFNHFRYIESIQNNTYYSKHYRRYKIVKGRDKTGKVT
ncbi:hypothetical protein RclHR1_01310014 [Rhizophagus clarus]|uniref:Tyrosine-protein kinase catalytic domain-containing protein n=1 Tax=Rhizophagus clarus TaxID=94130 RepID=A0A2Z6R1L3_9GLOM|nr:hypothetical protein RclHR1_01310014 [Rhizophagus clarus]